MKKVLIITYYWPPSGGVGVNRCLKFAKYLRDFGWEPIIYTAENANYPYIDEENLIQIPDNLTILKHKIVEPFRFYKFISGKKKDEGMNNPIHVRDGKRKFINNLSIWVRGNFFIPDARSLWIKPSVKYLSKYLKENHVDAILSNGPPHTNTVIACKLSKKFNIPWLADFQDPWTQVDYYKLLKLTKWADNKHKKLEQETFKTANKITIASPTWKKDLEKIGAENVDVIYWGYDEEDFSGLKQELDKKFTVFHAGLLGFDRHPKTLFKVLHDLKDEIKGFSKDFEIRFAGFVDYSVLETINEFKLLENFRNLGTIKRSEALQQTLNSHILLLLINKAANAKGRIPGKLFELLRANRPILALGVEQSDVQSIIKESSVGEYYGYDDYEKIKRFVANQYFEYKERQNSPDSISNILKYDVRNQTKKIAGFLNKI